MPLIFALMRSKPLFSPSSRIALFSASMPFAPARAPPVTSPRLLTLAWANCLPSSAIGIPVSCESCFKRSPPRPPAPMPAIAVPRTRPLMIMRLAFAYAARAASAPSAVPPPSPVIARAMRSVSSGERLPPAARRVISFIASSCPTREVAANRSAASAYSGVCPPRAPSIARSVASCVSRVFRTLIPSLIRSAPARAPKNVPRAPLTSPVMPRYSSGFLTRSANFLYCSPIFLKATRDCSVILLNVSRDVFSTALKLFFASPST